MENEHYLFDAPDISEKETQGKDSDQKPLKEERDLHAENYDFKQKLFLSKFGLERFGSNDDDIFFYKGFRNYRALMAIWNFINLALWVSDVVEHSTQKKWQKAPQTMLIHFLFFQERKSKEIEREK